MVHVAFLIDPIATLNLKKDSTLAMVRAALRRGWRVSCFGQADLAWRNDAPRAVLRDVTLDAGFLEALDPGRAPARWHELGPPQEVDFSTVDLVMMRKDPPFDMEYIYATYFLEHIQARGTPVVNDPRSLRDCNEKFFATWFPDCTPPLVIARRAERLLDFHAEHGDVVFKPLDGMGGTNIFRARRDDPNLRVIIENLTDLGRRQIMAQRYLPEIVEGDKRILLIDGEPVDYALARIPQQGESRGNLAAGGAGVGRPLTDRDRFIAGQVGPELARRGILFAGIDVIGDYLTEINVTCPTCIRELDAQFSLDVGGMLMDRLAERFGLSRAGGKPPAPPG